MHTFDLNSTEIVRAARIMTMAPGDPIHDDGAVLVQGGTICEVGTFADVSRAHASAPVRDLGDVTLVPGLVNAHCHLEMCHLKGRLEPGLGFPGWIRQMIATPMYELDRALIEDALETMKHGGTCLVGDISTRNTEAIAGICDDSGFFFVAFREHIFFAPPREGQEFIPDGPLEHGTFSAAGHALYTTHPETLRRAKAQCNERGLPFSLHLAEHEEESAVLMGEENAFTDLLREANIPLDDFTPPKKRPVQQARDLGLLDEGTLAVHCVTVDGADIDILRESGATVCLCPRSNEYIGVGRAPWEKLLAAGVNCCLGTDSQASNHDLDLWNEVRFMKERYAGELALETVVAMLTRNGAAVLGADGLGMIAPGRAARLAVVPEDVEQLFEQ